MVFIVWGPAINLAGYPAIQVIQKQSQGDIASNDDLLMMQMDGKLKKTSSLAYLKSVEGALLSIGKTLDDFKCPAGLKLLPLSANQVRLKFQDKWYIADKYTHQLTPQIPDNFNWGDIPVMCHMMDQGAIGVSAVHHMIVSMHLMVVVFYDYYHRIWNDIKNAAKASKGFFYAIRLKFSLVFNSNYGPFGKGA